MCVSWTSEDDIIYLEDQFIIKVYEEMNALKTTLLAS